MPTIQNQSLRDQTSTLCVRQSQNTYLLNIQVQVRIRVIKAGPREDLARPGSSEQLLRHALLREGRPLRQRTHRLLRLWVTVHRCLKRCKAQRRATASHRVSSARASQARSQVSLTLSLRPSLSLPPSLRRSFSFCTRHESSARMAMRPVATSSGMIPPVPGGTGPATAVVCSRLN